MGKDEKDKQARMIQLENESVEWLRQAEELRAAEAVAREASKKKLLILQMLQKLDDKTSLRSTLLHLKLQWWKATSQKKTGGQFCNKSWKGISVYQKLDPAVPYQTFKSTLLERFGYTDAKARRTVWRSHPSDQQSHGSNHALIICGINRLTQLANDWKDHVFEQFRGALTLYYSPEVCHSLRSKDYDSV